MPALGYRKDTCVHGHSRADAYVIKTSVSRGYGYTTCRTCAAVWAKAANLRRKRDRYIAWLGKNFPEALRRSHDHPLATAVEESRAQ